MQQKIALKEQLVPFSTNRHNIECELFYQHNILKLNYKIASKVPLLTQLGPPERKWGLWEKNCLEFFCSKQGKNEYFEFNFSLESEWNIFHLDNYREGIKEAQVENIGLAYATNSNCTDLIVEIPWEFSFDQYQISAVMVNEGIKEYYALAHSKDEADFHNRKLFTSF